MLGVEGSVRKRRMAADASGFSLIELVMVMAITGVLSVLAVPRFFQASDLEARGFLDESLGAIRFAQKRAVSTGCDIRVALDGSTLELRARSGCGTGGFDREVAHPARAGAFTSPVPGSVAVAGSLDIYFDRIGRPRAAAGTLLSTITAIEVGGQTLQIHPETGFARIWP